MNDSLREALNAELQARQVSDEVGVALAVVRDGELLGEWCHGHRDRARRLPVTPQTAFEIASLTKSFTGRLFSRLHARRELDLDAKLCRQRQPIHFCDPELEADATLADLLSHRTGLPTHDLLWYFGRHDSRELAKRVGRIAPLPGSFRRSAVYNNVLYGSLDAYLRAVVGAPLPSLLERELLSPLGLPRTGFAVPPDDDVALPYFGDTPMARKDTSNIAGASGLFSCVADLARWMIEELENDIAPKVAANDSSPIVLRGWEWLGPELSYGLGWFIGHHRNEKVFFHPGLIDGFSTGMALFPERNVGVVVLVNENLNPLPGQLVRRVIASLDQERPSDPSPGAVLPAGDEAPSAQPPEADLSGQWSDDLYGTLTVKDHSIEYDDARWPFRLTGARHGTVSIGPFFGLFLPVPFELVDGDLHVSLAMDPRVPPQRFRRL